MPYVSYGARAKCIRFEKYIQVMNGVPGELYPYVHLVKT